MPYTTYRRRRRGPKKMKRYQRKAVRKVGRLLTSKLNTKSGVHFFKRLFTSSAILGTGSTILGSYQYKLSDLPNVAEYQNLFTIYRIRGIKMKFYLNNDPSSQLPANANWPRMYWTKDYVTQVAPVSLALLKERSTVRTAVLSPTRPIDIYIKPATAEYDVNQGGGVSTYLTPQWGKFYNTLDANINHLGLHYGIDLLQSNASVSVDITYYLECRQPK